GNTTGCTIRGDTTGNLLNRDPQLGPLQDNGGPTFTHALSPGTTSCSTVYPYTCTFKIKPSPAIDGGNPNGCTDPVGTLLTTDQRGFSRTTDGNGDGIARCDIGAYEGPA